MSGVLYYKAAVNAEGQLVALSTDTKAYSRLSDALFDPEEAANLEAFDCRPVIVQVVRAYMVRSDVTEAPLVGVPVQ